MAESELVDDDEVTITKFIERLKRSGITQSDLRALADDSLVIPTHQLREAASQARLRARVHKRHEWLRASTTSLHVSEEIIVKLLEAECDQIFKVATATNEELRVHALLDEAEIDSLKAEFQRIDLENLRDDKLSEPERIEKLWGSWATVPTPIRLFYGI